MAVGILQRDGVVEVGAEGDHRAIGNRSRVRGRTIVAAVGS